MTRESTSGCLPVGKIVVLGGTGLIGRHVIEALVTAGVRSVVATYRALLLREGLAATVQWYRRTSMSAS